MVRKLFGDGRGVQFPREVPLSESREGGQFRGERFASGLSVLVGATTGSAGGKSGFVIVGRPKREEWSLIVIPGEKDGVHPAGDGFEEPRMMALGDREELQAAFVFPVEKDTAGPAKVCGEVVCEFVFKCRPDCGLERAVSWDDGLIVGGRGKGLRIGNHQFADLIRFFRGEHRAVVAAGGAATRELAGAQE